jgi:hypothetical protein
MRTKYSSGDLFLVGLTANDTPVRAGILQGINLNFQQEVVRLPGSNTFPEDLAGGPVTLTGDFEHGTLDARVIAKVLAGSTVASGYKKLHKATATIPGTPYQLTSAQAAGFVRDLGVEDANQKPMTKVASSPATGQYSVAAGVYTFAAADTGLAVSYAHTYTVAGAGGTVQIVNTALAAPVKCLLGLYNDVDGFGIELKSALILGLSWAIKTGQWLLPKMDFEACADSSNAVADIYIP